MRKIVLTIVIISALASLLVIERHWILVSLLFSDEPPELLEQPEIGNEVSWFDDYYIIEEIDSNTFAISEPRYHQLNINYLIVGDERAILFDAGTGLRNILPVAETLTDKPITFIPSHFHFDHVGNGVTFGRVAIVDLPHIRSRVVDGLLKLTWKEHLPTEGFDIPVFNVSEWLTPNEWIELGNRKLRVLYTPGHTDDSISLQDEQNGYLFAGDFIYKGPLYAFLPNSSMGDYVQGVVTLIATITDNTRIFGAHGSSAMGLPEQNLLDVHALGQTLRSIREGEVSSSGIYPVIYDINEDMELMVEPGWLQNWEQRYSDLQL